LGWSERPYDDLSVVRPFVVAGVIKGSASGGGKQIENERETEKRQYFVSAVLDLDVAGARAVVRARRET
jgi:hypothetical protein